MAIQARLAVRGLTDYEPVGTTPETVRAHRNENVLGAPPHVIRALRRLGTEDIARYPDREHAALVDALSRALAMPRDSIALANGADEILSAIIDSYAGEGDNVVVMSPSFEWYARFAARSGAQHTGVPYERRWEVDADRVIAACDPQTRLVLLANPNNPTGDSLPRPVLATILDALPGTLVVVDETYVDITGDTLIDELRDHRNLVVVRSMSKTAALAGLRLGYAVADAAVAQTIRKWMQPFCVNVAAATAGLAYLRHPMETAAFVARYRTIVERSLGSIAAACGPIARAVYPSAANFILVDFADRLDAVDDAFRRRGIIARRFHGSVIGSCLRISAQADLGTSAIVGALRELTEGAPDA